MSEKPETPIKPTARSGPESPTTARELDFDDDIPEGGLQSSAPVASSAPPTSGVGGEEAPPPKPPRPVDPFQQAEATLKEAFPTIDAAVVKAVLVASGGRVEPAFNALLGMSDPSAQHEPAPPPQPPRPTRSPLPSNAPTTTSQNQLEADEQYARQLAEHYSGNGGGYGSPRGGPRREPGPPRVRKQTGLKPSELYEDNRSFIDDDLPIIKENIRKGFLETQSKVNQWVAGLKKRLDGEDDDDFSARPAVPAQSYSSGPGHGGRRSGELGRRSADRDRYDSDPRVLGDDFGGLELRDDEGLEGPPRSTRPLANPDLFKPTPSVPSNGRKVSFQSGPPEDIDATRKASPKPALHQASPGGKASKWEPLSSVDPNPVEDNDPFSLGDSDDDKVVPKTKEVTSEDSERLKKAAAEAMADDIGADTKRDVDAHTASGLAGTGEEESEERVAGA
ncbi:MAG: ubiquitin-binding protein cue5 [Thelocarpon superellum]|nr:MAG: ubiquitin-binding protein cue5 [Thelocarpon superellum]